MIAHVTCAASVARSFVITAPLNVAASKSTSAKICEVLSVRVD